MDMDHSFTGSSVTEPSRTIPVFADVDVAVIGGGMAGVCAAVAAAGFGLSTVLIESFGCLGGTGTSGMVNCFCGMTTYGETVRKQIVTGIGGEICDRLLAQDALAPSSGYAFNPEVLKLILDQMAEENHVEVLFYTHVTDVISDNGEIKGVIIENKAGRQAVLARRTIDCTGDGDVCARAGAAFTLGDGSGGFLSCDLAFHMINVGEFSQKELDEKIKEFYGTGKYGLTRPTIIAREIGIKGAYWVNWAGIPWQVNSTDPIHLSRAVTEGRRIVRELRRFLRTEITGFENMDIADTAPMIGIRESRHVKGDYVLTKEDILKCTKFKDGIGACAWPLELVDAVRGREFRWLPKGEYYTIPYRVLLPAGIEQLLMAGRFVSCTHDAQSSLRIMGAAMVMGQAAGIAAGISIEKCITPRMVSPETLRSRLGEAGAFI